MQYTGEKSTTDPKYCNCTVYCQRLYINRYIVYTKNFKKFFFLSGPAFTNICFQIHYRMLYSYHMKITRHLAPNIDN